MSSLFNSNPQKKTYSFAFHHFFGEYIILKLDQDLLPGDFVEVEFNKTYYDRFDSDLKNFLLQEVSVAQVSNTTSYYFFPFGAKQGDYFLSQPTDFVVNKQFHNNLE